MFPVGFEPKPGTANEILSSVLDSSCIGLRCQNIIKTFTVSYKINMNTRSIASMMYRSCRVGFSPLTPRKTYLRVKCAAETRSLNIISPTETDPKVGFPPRNSYSWVSFPVGGSYPTVVVVEWVPGARPLPPYRNAGGILFTVIGLENS